ncbi:apolipoprotein N-acyltransferase [Marivivens aquimaris]|uniref:apolipoprotein N-acyltransferase n=1 Tax=Marivivens aquimaris TaxID=2774876 RepID=UPI00187ECDD8|nr:apolipoprotein N-acyltransferase [Marivivens aquimaris]
MTFGAPVLAGLLMMLGQEPLNFAYLIVPALVLWAITSSSAPKVAAFQAWLAGVAYFGPMLRWIEYPFRVEADIYGWMAPFAAALLPMGLALFWAVSMWIAVRLGRGRAAWALGLILGEIGRAYLFTGFPWGQFAQSYLDTFAIHAVPFVGAYGLTVLIIMLTAALASLIIRHRFSALLAVFIGGAIALPYSPEPTISDGPMVRLVQPNARQEDKWDPDKMQVFYRRLIQSTMAGETPDLVVWPETSVPYLLNYAGDVIEQVSDVARGAPVVVGINREEDMLYYNSMVVVGRGGELLDTYDKRHLVPFGEYVPFGNLLAEFGIHGLAANEGSGFSEGTGSHLIEFANIGKVRPLICYEGIFPSLSHSDERPRALMLITNDGWFGPDAGPMQHLAQARLRAIEQGLPLIRVANTGVTAMIDSRGVITASMGMGEEGYIDAPLPVASAPTVYSKLTNIPLVILIVLTAGIAILARRKTALT